MNKKKKNSWIRFILMIIVSGMVGALTSILLIKMNKTANLSILAKELEEIVILNIPMIQLVVWIPSVFIITFLYNSGNKLYQVENRTDEQEDLADKRVSIGMTMSTFNTIYIFSTFAIAMSEPQKSNIIVILIILLVTLTINTTYEVVGVKIYQKYHPEQKGDPLEFRFQKDWLSSCDEGQKMMTYVAGFKTAMLMKNLFIAAWLVLVILSLFIEVGIVSFVLLGIFWAVFTISYSGYSYQIEKGRIKY